MNSQIGSFEKLLTDARTELEKGLSPHQKAAHWLHNIGILYHKFEKMLKGPEYQDFGKWTDLALKYMIGDYKTTGRIDQNYRLTAEEWTEYLDLRSKAARTWVLIASLIEEIDKFTQAQDAPKASRKKILKLSGLGPLKSMRVILDQKNKVLIVDSVMLKEYYSS
jgi:hypothetical protein